MLTESHEKKEAWKQVWFLTQKDSKGNYQYRKGLKPAERADLLSSFYDFLDYERAVEVGDRLGTPDETPSEREKSDVKEVKELAKTKTPLLDIHNPALYSLGKGLKWIPFAEDGKSGAKRGQYRDGYPRGLVVHWTAGHRNGLEAGNELMRNTGMLYLIGDKDGNLGQSDSLAYHGYHAGKSSHKYANGYVSDEFAGIELQAAGVLKKSGDRYYSWFKTAIPASQVVHSDRNENIAPGYYHIYTPEQMLLLRKLVCWMFLNNPTVFSIDRVVGHDEVSPGRKVDPGASTITDGKDILTMRQFRELCWNDVDKIREAAKG